MKDIRVVHDQSGTYSDWVGYHEPIQALYWHEYIEAKREPHYPVPAIPLQVKYDYLGCLNIDDVTYPDDPIVVYMWDSWSQQNV